MLRCGLCYQGNERVKVPNSEDERRKQRPVQIEQIFAGAQVLGMLQIEIDELEGFLKAGFCGVF